MLRGPTEKMRRQIDLSRCRALETETVRAGPAHTQVEFEVDAIGSISALMNESEPLGAIDT